MIGLLEAEIGVAVIPDTSPIPETLKRTNVAGLDARRTVHLYRVAGRGRTAVTSAVMRMLRGADWRASSRVSLTDSDKIAGAAANATGGIATHEINQIRSSSEQSRRL